MNHLEIEFKTMLTEEEYHSLLPLFNEVQQVSQTNHYLDTPDQAIRKLKSALRVRTFEDHAELTLKVPETVGHFEYNQALNPTEANHILNGIGLPEGEIRSLLQAKNIDPHQVKVWGSLQTDRYETQLPAGLVALDQSHYLDTSDYELEIEVQSAQEEAAFHQFLKDHHITYKPAKSKVARLAERL